MTNSIAENIKKQIQEKKITMRPKAYFTLGAIAIGVGLTLAVLVSVFSVSITAFRFRLYQPTGFLSLGNEGVVPFISTFPWVPILISLVALLIGIVLMRKYAFSYKHAFIGITGGFVITMCVVGIIVDATGITSQTHAIPGFEKIITSDFDNDTWVVGTITTLRPEHFMLTTPVQQIYTVTISPSTIVRPPIPLQTGEWVRVIGDRNSDETFEAEIIMHQTPPRGIKHLYRGSKLMEEEDLELDE